jgi:hypothetical protein
MAMESSDASSREQGSRPPEIGDIVRLCEALNREGAKYLVIGGFAIIQAGYPRFTEDLDLLIDTSLENEACVLKVLARLPDGVAAQVAPGEISHYGVVRISDEIMVDLMKSGCGITYADAIADAVWRDIDGIRIPFASKPTLWRMKQTLREKDIPDRIFLAEAMAREGIKPDPPIRIGGDELRGVPHWLRRILSRLFPSA